MNPVPPCVLPVTITDPCPLTDAPRNLFEQWCRPWLADARDLLFVRVALRATLILLPLCASQFAVSMAAVPAGALWLLWLPCLLALPYLWLLYAVFGGPVLLMVHALEHRPAFTGQGRLLQGWIRHGLPLLYGISPFAYRAHHLVMHHAEENRPGDVSSTLGYRRDNLASFTGYWLRFLLLGNVDLARYLWRRQCRRALRRFLAGEAAHLLLIAAGLWFAPVAATITMLVPYALTRFFLMAGNWAQHAFVDESAIEDGVRNATILVNASHNHRCFNDGYHAVHHQHPGLHWGDMSSRFQSDWCSYADHGVLVFAGVPNNQAMWWHLMRKNYDFLARHLVDLHQTPRSHEQKVALLRQRARCLGG